jgi:hypothetical protein
MALPTYNRDKRRKNFKTLPKGAYVVQIKSVRVDQNKSGSGQHLTIAYDIAEGEYKDYFQKQFDSNQNEDKKWPRDAIYYLTVPADNSAEYVFTNWNTFFADLEDSNDGFRFQGDEKTLKGKLIGGKFYLEQSEYNGNIYDHIRLRWTCVAEDVRTGNYGSMPKDKLIETLSGPVPAYQQEDDFLAVPEGADDEVPF